MLIDLYDTSEFIKVNKLEEVTDPVLFIKGSIASPDGLLSTDIFGTSTNERKTTYAYIDLHGHFFHPFIYKVLKRMNRAFEHIVHSTRKYIIKDGQLVEDENGETGLTFIYNNWDKLNFEKNNSLMRNERIDLLTAYKKNTIFTKYWIVIPAFYRDVNFQSLDKGKPSHNQINDMYAKLIRLASMIQNGNNFDFVLDSTKAKIQEQLVEIYDFIKGKLEKKQGMIRKNLLGKSIDAGSRTVISAPTFHANSYKEMNIDFYHTGVPLSQCCALFNPFITQWIKNFFRREFETSGKQYPVKTKDGKIELVELKDPELYFNDDFIKKKIDEFVYSYSDRFKPIELPTTNKQPLYFSFAGRIYDKNNPEDESNIINRPATWCDILYQAAVDVTSDKMILVTRYPVTDYFSSFPSQITVLSTKNTIPVYINDRVYPNYPLIDLTKSKTDVSISFLDTLVMSNLYLKGLGGDYDGDLKLLVSYSSDGV